MKFKIEEVLEIVAVIVITINAMAFSAGHTVYERIHKSEEIKLLYLDPDLR